MNEQFDYVKKLYFENILDVTMIEENIQTILYAVLAFTLPLMLGHPQLLVGTLVNMSLILGATYLRGYKLLPVILLPSLGVLSRGIIFGPYTIFLVFMIPFIWIGNAIFAYGYKHFTFKKMNKVFGMILSAVLKSGFLFGTAYILVKLSVLPVIFLTTMGLLQIETALMGGALALGIIKAREYIKSRAA